MKKMRVRKWLKVQKSQKIYLINGEDIRMGQQNVEKLMRLSRRFRKQILINVQPKVEIYDESSLVFSAKEYSRTNLNKPNILVTQSLEWASRKWIN